KRSRGEQRRRADRPAERGLELCARLRPPIPAALNRDAPGQAERVARCVQVANDHHLEGVSALEHRAYRMPFDGRVLPVTRMQERTVVVGVDVPRWQLEFELSNAERVRSRHE